MADIKIIQYKTGAHGQDAGTHIKQSGMRPPVHRPGMLNKEMAEAAAAKFKARQKDIQDACSKVDAKQGRPVAEDAALSPPTEQKCACIIL